MNCEEYMERHLKTSSSALVKKVVKKYFIVIFHAHISFLIEEKQYEEIFNCFEEFQLTFPDDGDVLNAIGICLNRLEKPLEAIEYFKKALQFSPKKLSFLSNLENTVNQWVPRWHFSMLNDKRRNESFRKAIEKAIKKGETRVLDIGTGTGLLSLFCWSAGAKEIYACEEDEIMSNIARRVFKDNRVPVKIIMENSTNINISVLGIPRFDLVVTEIFDCGAFGEGVLATLIHAKKELLSLNGRVIPNAIEIFVVGVKSPEFEARSTNVGCMLDYLIYLKNIVLIPDTDGPYDPIDQHSKLKFLTNPISAFFVDLNNSRSMEQAIKGFLDCELKLISLGDDYLEGFLVYFHLFLNDDYITNYDSYKNKKCSSWDPIVFPLEYPKKIVKDQIIKIGISCKDGILKIIHSFINNLKTIRIDSQILAFLSDEELIYELERNMIQAVEKIKKTKLVIGDFMSFPHIGMKLLKENKLEQLYCHKTVRTFVNTIAECNHLNLESVTFVEDLTEFMGMPKPKFDFVLLQPLTGHSTLNEGHLRYYKQIKSTVLEVNGVLVPQKIDICCKIVHSVWLDNVAKMNAVENDRYGIGKYINEYATSHQFDFSDLEYNQLSRDFTISTAHFDDGLHEKTAFISLYSHKSFKINGILYFYKIYFMSELPPLSTCRKNSFSSLNCYTQEYSSELQSVKVNFIQNEFLFRCFIQT